mmetsp:Transcript_37721/g.58883  ORF Transcript_37721/g.58883 Transcript_37721/m.58883 type:complete len:94 (+) Transcript_37721:427-708(+)
MTYFTTFLKWTNLLTKLLFICTPGSLFLITYFPVAKEELPPMWVPLATGAVLFVGIGVLQASLGDVMEAEAGLGSASGARARKENTRRKKFLD